MKRVLVAALLGLYLLLVSSAQPEGCAARQPIRAAFQQFDVLETRANTTLRSALAAVIEDMETARRVMEEINLSTCDQDVIESHHRVTDWMDAEITTFSAVMWNDITDDPQLKWHVQDGLTKRSLAQAGVDRIVKR